MQIRCVTSALMGEQGANLEDHNKEGKAYHEDKSKKNEGENDTVQASRTYLTVAAKRMLSNDIEIKRQVESNALFSFYYMSLRQSIKAHVMFLMLPVFFPCKS